MLINDCVSCYLLSYSGSFFVSVLFFSVTDSPTLSLLLLTSTLLMLKLPQFPPIDSLVFCGFILSQDSKFQWLFIAFCMRDLGVM